MYNAEKSAGQSPFWTSKHLKKSGFPVKIFIVYIYPCNAMSTSLKKKLAAAFVEKKQHPLDETQEKLSCKGNKL